MEKEKKNLSLVNALGYVIALRLGIAFLTDDKAFKDVLNVGCVKRFTPHSVSEHQWLGTPNELMF